MVLSSLEGERRSDGSDILSGNGSSEWKGQTGHMERDSVQPHSGNTPVNSIQPSDLESRVNSAAM